MGDLDVSHNDNIEVNSRFLGNNIKRTRKLLKSVKKFKFKIDNRVFGLIDVANSQKKTGYQL